MRVGFGHKWGQEFPKVRLHVVLVMLLLGPTYNLPLSILNPKTLSPRISTLNTETNPNSQTTDSRTARQACCVDEDESTKSLTKAEDASGCEVANGHERASRRYMGVSQN